MIKKITNFLTSLSGLVTAIVLLIGAMGALYGAIRSTWVKSLFDGKHEQRVSDVKRDTLEAEKLLQEAKRKLAEEQKRTQVARLEPGPPAATQMEPKGEALTTSLRKPPPKGLIGQQVKLTQLISARAAEEYLETLDWQRYEAYRALITESESGSFGRKRRDIPITDEPAIILVLKDEGWTAEFHGHKLGFGGVQPMAGDVRKATLTLLKRQLSPVYRAHIGGDEYEDLAIILIPQLTRLRATTRGNTIGTKIVGPETSPFNTYTVRFTR